MKKLLILWIILLFPAWMTTQGQDNPTATKPKVEVYYFHATMRCPTCLAVEEQTRKTLEESFATEMKDGTLQLVVLNLEDKENKDLVKKFGVGWSSLVLYVTDNQKEVNLTEYAFANARSHPDDFRKELQKKIQELL